MSRKRLTGRNDIFEFIQIDLITVNVENDKINATLDLYHKIIVTIRKMF